MIHIFWKNKRCFRQPFDPKDALRLRVKNSEIMKPAYQPFEVVLGIPGAGLRDAISHMSFSTLHVEMKCWHWN